MKKNQAGHLKRFMLATAALILLFPDLYADIAETLTAVAYSATETPTCVCYGGLFDDFEDNNDQNYFGGYWRTKAMSVTATVSPANFLPTSPGYASSYAARFTGTVSDNRYYPFVGMEATFDAGSNYPNYPVSADLRGCIGIRFYVKGDGKTYQLRIPYLTPSGNSMTGDNEYKHTVPTTSAWTQIQIPFTDFTQEVGWGTVAAKSSVLAAVRSIDFISWSWPASGTQSLELWVDNLEFYACSAMPPPKSLAATYTPTANQSPTPTRSPTIDLTTALDYMLEDFEDNNAVNALGGYWDTYAAGNNASVAPGPGSFSCEPSGYNSSYSGKISGTVGTQSPDYPMIGMTVSLDALSGSPYFDSKVDLRECTGIRFYAKGDGKLYNIQIPYLDESGTQKTGYNEYRFDFVAPATWTLVEIPFVVFAQAYGWGTTYPLDTVLANAKTLHFYTSTYASTGTTTNELWIDDIQFWGCRTYPPSVSVVGTATYTPTPGGTVSTPTYTTTPYIIPSTYTRTPTPVQSPTIAADSHYLEDFEDGDNVNLLGGYWTTYMEGNGASVNPAAGTFSCTSGGYALSAFSGSFSGNVGTLMPDYPSIGMEVSFDVQSGRPDYDSSVDLRGCSGIRFYAKGDGRLYHIKIPYVDENGVTYTGYNDYRYDFTAPSSWTLVDIPYALFAQATGWGTSYPIGTVLSNARVFQFQTSFYASSGTTTAELWIDNIHFWGCTAYPPPVTSLGTATDTPTPGGSTNTPTNTRTPYFTNTITYTWTPTQIVTPTSTIIAGVYPFENFEDMDGVNNFGGYWKTYAAGNNTSIVPVADTFAVSAGGNSVSSYSAHFTGTVGTQLPDYPAVGIETSLRYNSGSPSYAGSLDISDCTGIRFYAKGNGAAYQIKLPYLDSSGNPLDSGDSYKNDFIATSSWTLIDLPFALYSRTGTGGFLAINTVLSSLKVIRFENSFYSASGTAPVDLWIDDVSFYGCSGPVPGFTVTVPFTRTVTPTPTITVTSSMTRTITLSCTASPVYTFTVTKTSTVTATVTVTPTTSPTPVLCNGVTPPYFMIKMIYSPDNSDRIDIEVDCSVLMYAPPVLVLYPYDTSQSVINLTTVAVSGDPYLYKVSVQKTPGYGDIERIIASGYDYCGTFGQSTGAFEKVNTAVKDVTVMNNVINPDMGERVSFVYNVKAGEIIRIRIYSRTGVFIKELVNNTAISNGSESVSWDGRNESGLIITSGVYFVNFYTSSYSVTEKVAIIR